MRLGSLDRMADLLGPTETRDAYNESVTTWSVIARVWCRVQHQPGREFVAAAQLHAEERAVITIRYRAGLTAKHRIRVDGREFDIRSIRELGRRRYLELSVTGVI